MRNEPTGLSRRGLLGGALGAAVALPIAAHAATTDDPAPPPSFPFEGAHQQGILTPAQASACYLALDVVGGRTALVDALRTITHTARFLTAGGHPPDNGLIAPAWDSGVLGPVVPADGLTITVSVGASLFDHRFGLHGRRPAHLRRMEEFPGDALDRSICDGDLMIQVCAHHPDAVVHGVRQLLRSTRGALAVRWRRDGFMSPPRPSGTPRNLLGFKDGTANPSTSDAALMDELVWTRPGRGEPTWVAGGSYHVVRVIRMLVEFWDRISVREQQEIFGRDRDTGAPLTGTHEFDEPDFADDPNGEAIPYGAHIRLANPRTKETTDQRILRRSYNYDAGVEQNGNLDMGLIFTCFNADLDRQFVTVQKRLQGEPLGDYISPVGGGYFFALPGVRGAKDWLGSAMLG